MNFEAMSALLIISVTIILAATTKLSTAVVQPSPDCKTTCGSLTNINFPFGMSEECYLDFNFSITCNKTFQPPKAFYGSFPVLSISHEDSTMRIQQPASHKCYDSSGSSIWSSSITWTVYSSKFPISNSRNMFIGVGCETVALFTGANYSTGCVADCNGVENTVNGSCTGIGCCESKIPSGENRFRAEIWTLNNHSRVVGFNPCSYVFLAEEGSYSFNSLHLWNMSGQDKFPIVLDWAVDKVPCSDAKRNKSSYACRSSSSECVNSANGPGYRCNCSVGFRGNPYVDEGCKDIDECIEKLDKCGDGSKCINSRGNYSCPCEEGYEDVEGVCRKKSEKSTWQIVSPGVSVCLLLLLLLMTGSSSIYLLVKKKKLMKQRERFFEKHGGLLLRQQLSEQEGSDYKARIFTEEDLKRATNNYNKSRIIGQGASGTVYQGELLNNREVVAIKKSKTSNESQMVQFINEVVIVSKIYHENVVKLIGCCLETEVPSLVYEFINNKTLSDHIHNETRKSSLSWERRLNIAAEIAGAIAYIQYEIPTPIIHRDIKSTNILLDHNYAPKVSDFGASIFVPLNKTQLTTLVQGTYGYLDPEFFQSNQLTMKSDVYSFGVVLAELLTGKEALSFDGLDEDRFLATYFVSAMKDDRLDEILDDNLEKVANKEQIKEVAKLVEQCLRVKGEERPTMKDLAAELKVIRVTNRY